MNTKETQLKDALELALRHVRLLCIQANTIGLNVDYDKHYITVTRKGRQDLPDKPNPPIYRVKI